MTFEDQMFTILMFGGTYFFVTTFLSTMKDEYKHYKIWSNEHPNFIIKELNKQKIERMKLYEHFQKSS